MEDVPTNPEADYFVLVTNLGTINNSIYDMKEKISRYNRLKREIVQLRSLRDKTREALTEQINTAIKIVDEIVKLLPELKEDILEKDF
ncbi:hypothetical protein DRN75_02695 [Nanoarchaeota archaeon]|nr:MAG: hypothetical protein DRN75_02695 [Nanoarchaeota archaeon]